MRNPRVALICAALAFGLGLLALPFLPDQVPSHWNMRGEVDGYSSPLQAALMQPLIILAIAVILPRLPKIDPRRENYAQFQGTYDLTLNAIVLFLTTLHALTLAFALGARFDLGRLVFLGIGVLIAVIGNELGRVQPNYFMGIRTPWTLADEAIWRRTHRVGGRMLAGAGVVAALAALLLPLPIAAPIGLIAILGAAFGSMGYSYMLWRERESDKAIKR
jgi:uncharacterized membrane protein